MYPIFICTYRSICTHILFANNLSSHWFKKVAFRMHTGECNLAPCPKTTYRFKHLTQ